MKKLFLGLSLMALLAGCASNDTGMGGTSDTTSEVPNKTDEYNTTNNSSDQFNNNATHGTGTDSTINNNSATNPNP